MKIIFLIIFQLISFFASGKADLKHYADCFFDSSELKILLEAKNGTLYYLEGSYQDDSMKIKGRKYIMNFKIAHQKKVSKIKLRNLQLALLNCSSYSEKLNKCSFSPLYCIKLTYNNRELFLFFSQLDFCEGQIKVVKKNKEKESSITYSDSQFKNIF